MPLPSTIPDFTPMIIFKNLDSRESLEKQIKELILRKLFIKINKEYVLDAVAPERYVELLLSDIVLLAESDGDLKKALHAFSKQHPDRPTSVKEIEFQDILQNYTLELEAYEVYLDELAEGLPYEEIYNNALSTVNADEELLERRLFELIETAVSRRVSQADADRLKITKESLTVEYAARIKYIASYDNFEDAAEAACLDLDRPEAEFFKNKARTIKEFELIAPQTKDEISAYRMALDLERQNAEIPMILAMVRQLLRIEES